MNTHEQYVSLETAKLLKRAGFDWDVKTFYTSSGNKLHEDNWYPDWYDKENIDPTMIETFSAPTQSVAMRWLREVKNCIIEPYFSTYNDKYMVKIIRPRIIKDVRYFAEIANDDQFYETYEQAAEVGIQECLKAILNEQEQ